MAKNKESQDICFSVPKSIFRARSGPILNINGKKIGEHKGLAFYTIGQRKGIEIGGTGPYYVIGKDFKNNALIVSHSEKDLLQKELMVKNINWINESKKSPLLCGVKIRSTAKISSAKIDKIKNFMSAAGGAKLKIIFLKPQRAITPGQSAVFYRKNEVLGGGIIV